MGDMAVLTVQRIPGPSPNVSRSTGLDKVFQPRRVFEGEENRVGALVDREIESEPLWWQTDRNSGLGRRDTSVPTSAIRLLISTYLYREDSDLHYMLLTQPSTNLQGTSTIP